MKISHLEAGVKQIPVILEMMEDFNSIYGYSFEKKISERNLNEFICNKSLGRLWIIDVDKNSVGYVVLSFGFSFEYRGKDAFIDEIFIKEEFRHMGIGTKTMEFIEIKAKEFQIRAIHMEVEKDNQKAKRLYLKQGYSGNKRELLTRILKE